MGFITSSDTTLMLVGVIKGRMWHRSKGKVKGKPSTAHGQEHGQPEPQETRAPRPGIPLCAPNKRGEVRAVYRSSDGRLVSDDFDPLPPLPHEQAGLPSQERCAQTLTVYPRNAGTIPGAHGPIEDPKWFPRIIT